MFNNLALEAKFNSEKKEYILLKLEPLIKSSINKYYRRNYLFEDLLQEGRLEILESIEDYKPDKGVPFLGYIKLRLKYLYLNKNKEREEESLSLNSPVEMGNCELIDLVEDGTVNIEEDILRLEGDERLYRAYDSLTSREKEVIGNYYFAGKTMVEISKLLNLSYRTIVNTKTRALNKLKKEYY